MKKIFGSLLFFFVFHIALAQTSEKDSLNRLLTVAKEDTNKVKLLLRLSFLSSNGMPLAQEGYALAKKLKYEKGEADCLLQLGNEYRGANNNILALHYYLESLKLKEKANDPEGYSRALNAIGSCYYYQGDYPSALSYYRQGYEIQKKFNYNYRLAYTTSNIGETFEAMTQLDSALRYYQDSYRYFTADPDKYQMAKTLKGLGNVHFKMGNNELALSFYRMGVINAIAYDTTSYLADNYLGIARLFQQTGKTDSSIQYAKSAIAVARNRRDDMIINANKLLSELYLGKDDRQSIKYLSIAMDAKDSSLNAEKTLQIQNLLYNEQERQREIAAADLKAKEERKRNLQYAAIALGLITFIILFLLLSHSIMANQKLIRFLGVIALLIVFEFTNLFIHPYLSHATNDSPFIMLLVMVCIAALLVPIHHRMEKWISHRLVEKNRKIRLNAAKRTIAKLETDPSN